MKRLLSFCSRLAACGKSNDVATLHHEAVQTAAYYATAARRARQRASQAIFKRGTTIPGERCPASKKSAARLTEARDTIVQLRGIVAKGPDGKSAVEKQADARREGRRDRGPREARSRTPSETLDRGRHDRSTTTSTRSRAGSHCTTRAPTADGDRRRRRGPARAAGRPPTRLAGTAAATQPQSRAAGQPLPAATQPRSRST